MSIGHVYRAVNNLNRTFGIQSLGTCYESLSYDHQKIKFQSDICFGWKYIKRYVILVSFPLSKNGALFCKNIRQRYGTRYMKLFDGDITLL